MFSRLAPPDGNRTIEKLEVLRKEIEMPTHDIWSSSDALAWRIIIDNSLDPF